MAMDSRLTLNSDPLVELYKANMRTFKWRLAKRLYGNAYQRHGRPLVWIPVLEGLRFGQKPHYHCMLGVSEDRFPDLEQRIQAIWADMPFGGDRVSVERYRDQGWISYSTKSVMSLDLSGIDWDNVLVPQA